MGRPSLRRTFALVSPTLLRWLITLWAVLFRVNLPEPASVWGARGELELRVIDADSGEPMAVELQLRNSRGNLVTPAGMTRQGRWLTFDGQAVLQLPPGKYSFRARRGLEYRERTGEFYLSSAAADQHTIDLPRFVNMAKEGWWSGDLQVDTSSPAGLSTRILASDLHLICLTGRDNAGLRRWPDRSVELLSQSIGRDRFIEFATARDVRDGSTALLVSADGLPEMPPANQPLPTPWELAAAVSGAAGDATETEDASTIKHVHLAHVPCWDLPVWIAHGQVDSVGLLHGGIREETSVEATTDRPRDKVLYPDPEGVARWAQQVYFHLLECGLRLPPGAGSGADASGNLLGFSRVYVHCGETFSPAAWWDGLRRGQVVVTNGPLLRPRVDGHLPGHVFQGRAGETLSLDVSLQLSTQEKIRYLEIIQNGRPVHQVRLEDWVKQSGQLPPVVFEQSGWFLIRAVAEHAQGYRAALSGPYYVELGEPRISRQAAQFFLDWVYERARRVRLEDAEQQRAVLLQHRRARDFWQERVDRATVD